MNLIKNGLLGFGIIILLSIFSNAQDGYFLEKGIKKHKGIDEIYKVFREAYKTLDAEKISNLYSEDAVYLAPNENISIGRKSIQKIFSDFFIQTKEKDENIRISFHIFQRKIKKHFVCDVGVYTVSLYKKGKKIGQMKAKFVVVALKKKNNKWEFQVDSYN